MFFKMSNFYLLILPEYLSLIYSIQPFLMINKLTVTEMTKTYWVQEFHLQAGGANSLETINRLKHPYPKSQYSIGEKVRSQNKSGKWKAIFSKKNNVKRVKTYKYMYTFIQIKVYY